MTLSKWAIVVIASVVCISLKGLSQSPHPPEGRDLDASGEISVSSKTYACAIDHVNKEAFSDDKIGLTKGMTVEEASAFVAPDGFDVVIMRSGMSGGYAHRRLTGVKLMLTFSRDNRGTLTLDSWFELPK